MAKCRPMRRRSRLEPIIRAPTGVEPLPAHSPFPSRATFLLLSSSSVFIIMPCQLPLPVPQFEAKALTARTDHARLLLLSVLLLGSCHHGLGPSPFIEVGASLLALIAVSLTSTGYIHPFFSMPLPFLCMLGFESEP
jgi:hypothetical protein